MAFDDFENYLTRYTGRDYDPDAEPCMGCGQVDCECDDDPDDCLGCGMCDWCIERSIRAAEEADPPASPGLFGEG